MTKDTVAATLQQRRMASWVGVYSLLPPTPPHPSVYRFGPVGLYILLPPTVIFTRASPSRSSLQITLLYNLHILWPGVLDHTIITCLNIVRIVYQARIQDLWKGGGGRTASAAGAKPCGGGGGGGASSLIRGKLGGGVATH